MLSSVSSGTPKLPQRVSLSAQTAAVIKEGIEKGIWAGRLPGEHDLCARLQVSRVTLRRALNELQREGWLKASQGRAREILSARRTRKAPSNRVLLLSPVPVHQASPFSIFWMDCLRENLAESGYHLEIHAGQGAYGAHLHRTLEDLEHHLRPAGWVVYRSNIAIQQWFSERSLPCVITGSRHPDIKLPSVDLDYRAICRHAGGQFLARGHHQLALLNPESGTAGELQSEEGFLEAVNRTTQTGAQATVVRHDGTVEGICRKVDLLLERANRPTAFLVARPYYLVTVLGHLIQRGLRLPRDAALIGRDDDTYMAYLVPSVARYSSNPTAFARKVSNTVLNMVRGTPVGPQDLRLMPRFVPGQTLG